jgi:hypothetical protein
MGHMEVLLEFLVRLPKFLYKQVRQNPGRVLKNVAIPVVLFAVLAGLLTSGFLVERLQAALSGAVIGLIVGIVLLYVYFHDE